jgi:hypothetical protein
VIGVKPAVNHFTVISEKLISLIFISHPFKGGDPTFQFISFHDLSY